ncbi:MAG: hypothetical protein E7575_05895 [Ruminococcaceae bacterium]|nr:hypothetical protein [Oscillospiraceae bacterium]
MKKALCLILCICFLAACLSACSALRKADDDEAESTTVIAENPKDSSTADQNDTPTDRNDTDDEPCVNTGTPTPPDTENSDTTDQDTESEENNIPAVPGTEMFDNVAFVGDSISLKLQYYHAKTGEMGNATFLCSGSYAVRHAVDSTMLIPYKGQNMSPEDALALCGAEKVFILLGMNDIGLLGIDKTIENWGIFVERIKEKCPGIKIYIQSETPIYKSGEKGKLTNENVDAYNARLEQFARDNGCEYLDISFYMKDSSGGLLEKYCSDSFVHFTDEACKLWINLLKQCLA